MDNDTTPENLGKLRCWWHDDGGLGWWDPRKGEWYFRGTGKL